MRIIKYDIMWEGRSETSASIIEKERLARLSSNRNKRINEILNIKEEEVEIKKTLVKKYSFFEILIEKIKYVFNI